MDVDPAPGERVTFRAVVLGVITIVLTAVYLSYHGSNFIKSYLPVGVLLPFMVWVALNTALKIVFPRVALSRTEVLTILGMLWIAGNLPAIGWGLYSVSVIASPEFFASPENRLREVVLPFLPKWLFTDANLPHIRQVYTGLEPGASVPWLSWVQPYFWWFVGCMSAVMGGFFGSVLFFKQWEEKERLVFPMATFPVELLRESEGGRVPAVFRDRVFWIGFAWTAGIICWNIAGYFLLQLPRITLFDQYQTKAIQLGRLFPNYYLRVQPLLMGLAYLCPLDILFSFWVFNVIQILKVGMLNRTGFTVGIAGQPAQAGEITMLESHGALVFLVIWSIWVARRHLKETFRRAFFTPRSSDDGAPVSYRMAWIGLLLSVLALGGWCRSAGMTYTGTVAQMAFMFICFFGITKYAATTGFTFLSPPGAKGFGLIKSLGGTANLSPGDISMMTLINRNIFLGTASRVTAIPAITHFFRMLGGSLKRHPLVWGALPLAYLIGYVSSGSAYLFRCYSEGGLNGLLVSWPMDALVGQVPFIEGTEVTFFDHQKLTVWLFGGAEAGVLTYLRSRFAWWPFHPAALAFPVSRYAFCLVIVWGVKTLVLRFGGVTLYRRSLPFWYGTIVGYLFGIALSSVVDAVWFPDGGHFVHGW